MNSLRFALLLIYMTCCRESLIFSSATGDIVPIITWSTLSKGTYHKRWAIESSFRKLSYTIGRSNFHSRRPKSVKLELWAKLIAYNATELLVNHAVVEKHDTKYLYEVNFTKAAHICRVYLRLTKEINFIVVMPLLLKELIPVREERQFERLQTDLY